MHLKTTLALVVALCAITPLAQAQEMETPKPAPELKKLEPLLGNWAGSGTMVEPAAGESRWTAASSYQWVLDGFWIQEDMTVRFENLPDPIVFRSYIGWDAEQKRYVTCYVSNNGEAGINELELMPDGGMLAMAMHWDQLSFAERSMIKVDGDKMTFQVEFLMAEGPSLSSVNGTFQRVDAAAPSVLGAGPFMGAAPEAMTKLCRGAGAYDIQGSMIMAPGAPAMKISGTDTYKSLFGGRVLHGHTEGAAEGMPDKYAAESFWAWDRRRECFRAIFVSNMGEVGEMEMHATPDGKAYVSTMSGTMMGQPMAQRFVLEVDDNGAFTGGVGHSMLGTLPPFESFRGTFARK